MTREPEQILDEFLVLQAQRGDSKSIGQLVHNWHSRFVRYADTIVHDREAASDVVQDSWIAIIKGIRKIGDPARFKSWAFRIVHNKSCDFVRKRVKRRQVRANLVEQISDPADAKDTPGPAWRDADKDDECRLLRAAIEKLKPADQVVVTLYYHEGLSINEMHEITGATKASLKSRLHQVRQRLRKILERKKNGQRQS